MEAKYMVCRNCLEESDTIKAKALVGDRSKIGPGIILAQFRCDRCKRVLNSNEPIFSVAKVIKVFLSEIGPDSRISGSFWAMATPTTKEMSTITNAFVEDAVREVFEIECGDRRKISDGVYISVFDKNDNKIFGGHIEQGGEITLIPITEIFQ